MNRTEIFAKARTVIAAALLQPEEAILESSTLQELNADSLDRVEIVMDCEEAFRVEISDAEAEEVQTVGQLVELLERLLAGNA